MSEISVTAHTSIDTGRNSIDTPDTPFEVVEYVERAEQTVSYPRAPRGHEIHSRHHCRDIAVIDGQCVNVANQDDLIREVIDRVNDGEGFTVATLNLDHLVKRRHDAAFRATYARITLVTADGAPIVALGRRQAPQLHRATGADLLSPLCARAADEGIPIYLFGSTEYSLVTAAARLRQLYPRINICGLEAPPQGFDPFSEEAKACAARIASSGARLCFVCLGAPKQEFFADLIVQAHPGIGCLCVGAALDFVAQTQRRAPGFMRRLGVEWFWRLASQPRRMAWRYAACAALLLEIAAVEPALRLLRTGLRFRI
jgi:exopolysaccharide biosynthesis WecB/TagA/CpsF family protein